jgi:predicted nucleotidyltransferase component of viral defense system
VSASYPSALRGIEVWAAANGTSVAEARFRFAQFGVLQAVAGSRSLSRDLVFKGGNALDFVWQPNRSTMDLDFSSHDSTLTGERITELLTASLHGVSRSTGVLYRVQRMKQQPPGANRSFITFAGSVGYALPGDRRNHDLLAQGLSSKASVPIEISLNEPICGAVNVDVQSANPLSVCQLEDIVAEKLRALLQQPIRNRTRPQDVLDIAVVLREKPALDADLVAEFLISKAAARHVSVSKLAFHEEEIRSRARGNYDGLKETTRKVFIVFDEAFADLLTFVDRLRIPER